MLHKQKKSNANLVVGAFRVNDFSLSFMILGLEFPFVQWDILDIQLPLT